MEKKSCNKLFLAADDWIGGAERRGRMGRRGDRRGSGKRGEWPKMDEWATWATIGLGYGLSEWIRTGAERLGQCGQIRAKRATFGQIFSRSETVLPNNCARLNGTIVRATCSGKWKEKNARNRFAEIPIMIVCRNGVADSSFHSPNDFAQSPNR